MVARLDLSHDLAAFAAELDIGTLGRSVVEAGKTNVLDTLACALAGSSARAVPEIAALVGEWSRFVTPALVDITFRDGTTATQLIDHAKGHPANPMTAGDMRKKAADCAAVATGPLARDASDRLAQAVRNLERAPDTVELVSAMCCAVLEPDFQSAHVLDFRTVGDRKG